jgi:hypothetical protein
MAADELLDRGGLLLFSSCRCKGPAATDALGVNMRMLLTDTGSGQRADDPASSGTGDGADGGSSAGAAPTGLSASKSPIADRNLSAPSRLAPG